MDSQAKEMILRHIEQSVAKLKDTIASKRPDGDPKEQATTWWQRGQVRALEQLMSDIKDDKEQD